MVGLSVKISQSARRLNDGPVFVDGPVFGVYPFRCKVYVHCIHCVYGHSDVDSEDKLYTFCMLCLRVLITFHIYLNTISYQVAAGQLTWARKRHNLFSVNFTFLCHFLKSKTSEEGDSRKVSGKEIICTVND